jgi:hypothetical protein
LPTIPIGTPQPSRVTVKLKQQLICLPVLVWPPGLEDDDDRFLSSRAGGVSVHVVRTAFRDLSKPTGAHDRAKEEGGGGQVFLGQTGESREAAAGRRSDALEQYC